MSALIFAAILALALCADCAPLWALIEGVVVLVVLAVGMAVAGLERTKKGRPRCAKPETAKNRWNDTMLIISANEEIFNYEN